MTDLAPEPDTIPAASPRQRVDAATAATLRALAEQLHETPTRSLDTFWGVPLRMCRAYVWAKHTGTDPAGAMARAWYGRDAGLFDEDPAWLDARRPHSKTQAVLHKLAALDAAGLTIPRAAA